MLNCYSLLNMRKWHFPWLSIPFVSFFAEICLDLFKLITGYEYLDYDAYNKRCFHVVIANCIVIFTLSVGQLSKVYFSYFLVQSDYSSSPKQPSLLHAVSHLVREECDRDSRPLQRTHSDDVRPRHGERSCTSISSGTNLSSLVNLGRNLSFSQFGM